MKLVEILAREVSEWPNGCDWAVSIKGEKGFRATFGKGNLPKPDLYDKSNHTWSIMESDPPIQWALVSRDLSGEPYDRLKSIVTESQWQAERDRQRCGEWKRHRAGRKQPVPDGINIEAKFRDGEIHTVMSDRVDWIHYGNALDLMQYRVISQPQAEEVEMIHSQESLKRAEINLMGITEGTFTQGPISLDNEVIYPVGPEWHTDQIDGPILWRDTVNELDAYIEEFTREREALINRLAEEGFALLPAMTPVMGVADVDMPIDQWQIGDIIEVVARKGANSHEFEIGEHVRIDDFDLDDDNLPVKCYALDESDFWYLKYEEAKFIRRP